ncbi:MAG TPA: ABC transporter ATP-binding protein [Candidatus Saccharibacteria bacterium]|nr:ABC transporter ATP-binding protein [Candidatus Saccharibacteria bacterium]
MASAIVLDKLTKYYPGSKAPAINQLSISIKSGEVYGFLGSNGAGKSTTIRLILDFIRPSSGRITVQGMDSVADSVAIRRHIGYLAGDVALPKRVTGRQLLHHLASLSGGIDLDYLGKLEKDFQAQLDKRIGTLSKGNRQKIGLIQALMSQPNVLVLDEPTSGLDPLMQEQFYSAISDAKKRGAAIFLSSHSFSEVERICDHIGIIRAGELVYEGTVASVAAKRMPNWQVTVSSKADAATLKKSKSLKVSNLSDLSLTVCPVASISSALLALSKVEIKSMTIKQDNLEDEFMSFYNQEGQK